VPVLVLVLLVLVLVLVPFRWWSQQLLLLSRWP
jgi:hypothetical protein